jgi:hypothetical protein
MSSKSLEAFLKTSLLSPLFIENFFKKPQNFGKCLTSLEKVSIRLKKPQFLWKCLKKESKSSKKPQITLKKP